MAPDPAVATAPEVARERLAGVRGVLLDMDGVLMLRGEAIAGAPDAVGRLRAAGVAHRILTNTSLVSRRTLSASLARAGIHLPPEDIVSALSATAGYTRDVFAGMPLYVLTSPDGRSEFIGQWLLSHAEADAPGATAAAVVVGDAPDELTYGNMNRAFRLVREGAALVAMHRNPWWLTAAGPTLDAGAYVVGLEYATGIDATVVGKPSREFFIRAIDDLGIGPLGDLVMVGDDLVSDIGAAGALGLRTALVLTGRHGPDDAAAAARGEPPATGAPIVPTVVAPSLAEVVEALAP
ncbi:MAG: HAD-IIA family hydrolase [Chloroflexi bacterium]|jgi:HAD superfamily hydrolase (TIGR01458 family)|nr:HAD-IIA family hydrolase [Chloroflexota bacterium]